MKSVSELQTGFRWHNAEGSITLTETTNLEIANQIYRGMGALLPWPELRREDTSVTSTKGLGIYTWPGTVIWLDVTAFEMQNAAGEYRLVYPPPDEWEWSKARNMPAQPVPDYYMRFATAAGNRFEVAPVPNKSGKTFRITGIVEPDALEGANSQTVFLQRAADDALEHMLASAFYYRDGFAPRAEVEMNKALTIFQQLFGKERVPVELLRGLVVRKE